ncbi:unnamed protein product [Amoebophrya sp. A25]|nr:unnamed protein product [Amoebophrya sp. A25]|eukprot:GSA25T00005263001.1
MTMSHDLSSAKKAQEQGAYRSGDDVVIKGALRSSGGEEGIRRKSIPGSSTAQDEAAVIARSGSQVSLNDTAAPPVGSDGRRRLSQGETQQPDRHNRSSRPPQGAPERNGMWVVEDVVEFRGDHVLREDTTTRYFADTNQGALSLTCFLQTCLAGGGNRGPRP